MVIGEILRHAVAHVLSLLAEKRLKADALGPGSKTEEQDAWRLSYSVLYRVMWSTHSVVWAIVVALMLWVWSEGRLDGRLALAIPLFSVFLAFSLLAARDGYTQQIELSPWGITERRSGTVATSFPWSAVARVRFLTYLDSYQIIPREGRPVCFSMHIQGLPRFKWLIREHAPSEALEGVRTRIVDPGSL